MYNEANKDPYGWLQTWARICAREFLRESVCVCASHTRQIISYHTYFRFMPHYIIITVVAPALGAAVILMIIVEFCADICCWTFFRSLLLSLAEISQAFTFVICKKHYKK